MTHGGLGARTGPEGAACALGRPNRFITSAKKGAQLLTMDDFIPQTKEIWWTELCCLIVLHYSK